jgi:hypothetical protein
VVPEALRFLLFVSAGCGPAGATGAVVVAFLGGILLDADIVFLGLSESCQKDELKRRMTFWSGSSQ